MLNEEELKEFKEIFEQETGQKLTGQEAFELGNKLINIFKVVYRPKGGLDEKTNIAEN